MNLWERMYKDHYDRMQRMKEEALHKEMVPNSKMSDTVRDTMWMLNPTYMRQAQRVIENGGSAFDPVVADPYEPDVPLFDRITAGIQRNPWRKK